MTRLHLPQSIVESLHVHRVDVVIPAPETVDLIYGLSNSQFLSVAFSIHGDAIGVATSAPQVAHYIVDAIYLPS